MEHLNLTTEAKHFLSQNCTNQSRKGVRLLVKGAGCAGFKYDWQFVETADDDDYLHTLSEENFLVIDPFTISMLQGSTIELEDTPFSKTLNIVNPMAKSECGCGESFAL
jgi:iron-sulfur cluster assembly accessory protein